MPGAQEDVRFTNDGITLAGTLTQPGTSGRRKEFVPGFLDCLSGWIVARTDGTGRAGKGGALVRSISTRNEEPKTGRKT